MARRLWALLREQVGSTAGADQDARRLKSVLGRRQSKSQEFFESAAGQWDKLREDLYGRGSHLQALPALLDPAWSVGDLGCGTGQVAAALAPFVARSSPSTDPVRCFRQRAGASRHSRMSTSARGELETLPIEDGELDAATLLLVLHHLAEPSTVLREAARVLKPGGRLLISDMLPHDQEEYRRQMGHVWLGFGDDQLSALLGSAGFVDVRIVHMPSNPDAKGPALFVASARRGN